MKTLFPVLAALLLLPSMADAEGEWEFTFAPYVWFTGLEGEVSTRPNLPAVPVDVGTSGLDDALAAVSMLFDAKKQRHGVVAEILYSKLESNTALIPAIDLTMRSTTRNSMFSAAYQYALYKTEGTGIDAYAGVRYWRIDNTMEFGGGLGILAGQTVRNTEFWYDPLIGVKGRTRFGESKFFATGWAVAGGFGVGSDGFYETSANIGYQWNESNAMTLGYRVYDVDYSDGSFLYDVKQSGWGLGLVRNF